MGPFFVCLIHRTKHPLSIWSLFKSGLVPFAPKGASKAEYDAATKDVAKIIEADVRADVPSFFLGRVEAIIPALSQAVAKAAIDAAEKVRNASKS